MSNSTEPEIHLYIDTHSGLQELLSRLEEAPEIALDTEADSLHHYFEKVCLIQLCAGEDNFIVDPLCGMDLSGLLGILARKPLVLHGADYDIRIMRATFGFQATEGAVFDTMLAARLLGYEELGLASLVERFFGVHLSKGGQKSDWSRRPISESLLRYASNDTRYLLPLAGKLREDLERLGRSPWHRETCDVMVRNASRENEKNPDEVWRIKKSGILSRGQLNVLRSLFHWRDLEARRVDLPPFKILGNRQLLELAIQAAARPKGGLPAGTKLPRNCTGKRLQALKEAFRDAAGKTEAQWPCVLRHEKRPPQVPKALQEAIRTECDRVAGETGIASSTLAPRAALMNILQHRPLTLEEIMECAPLMRWQAGLLEPGIQKILSGSAGKNRLFISPEA